MRSEPVMMDLILGVAGRDDRIRAVGMEGSRTNIHAPKDAFQDYDISYLVTDMAPFVEDEGWLDAFGPRIIMQKPEAMSLFPPSLGGWFSYLMLFEDGNRIDLKILPIGDLGRYLAHDRLLMILMDKDERVPERPPPTDIDYCVRRPTAEYYHDCQNEFWWVSTYVAKGLCRGELLYAAEHLVRYVRPSLLRMLAWEVGFATDFSLSMGKSYKYLPKFLPNDTYAALMRTHDLSSTAAIWRSLVVSFGLMRASAKTVGQALGCPYPDYDRGVTAYIEGLYDEHGPWGGGEEVAP